MALADREGQGDRAGLAGPEVRGYRAALLVLAGPVDIRRLATRPGAQLLPPARDPAVVKLAKYRFRSYRGE
jgi:hypothetical protein